MVRSGWVSNSSSSSFVLIMKEDDYQASLEGVHPYIRAVVETCMEPIDFGDENLRIFHGMDVMDYGMFEYIEVEYDGDRPLDKYGDEIGVYQAFMEEWDISNYPVLRHSIDG